MGRHEEAASRRERLGSPVTGSSARSRRLREQFTSNRGRRQGRGRPVRRADGRVIGQVRNAVFCKAVCASRHFLHTPPAIAFDLESLVEAGQAGAEVVRVEDIETGRVYAATMGQVRRRGFIIDRGHGVQLAVPLSIWSVTGSDRGRALQLGLFAGV